MMWESDCCMGIGKLPCSLVIYKLVKIIVFKSADKMLLLIQNVVCDLAELQSNEYAALVLIYEIQIH